MLMTDEWYDRLFGAPAEFSRSADFRIYIATKALVENVVGFNLHQGLMAVAECPPEPSLDELVNRSNGRAAEGLYVALDGLVNSENVGVVVRNAAAFEVDGIICGESSSSPYLRRAVRTSMGAVFSMSVFHPPSLGELLTRLREGSGMRVLAADASAGSSAWETDLRGRLCIVLGNEGEGISPAIREVCDGAVAIPMGGGTDSLNVGSASAALLSEIRRQRTSR
jgi:tRNA G18 (ribose-2'-O)-methylase SpoU